MLGLLLVKLLMEIEGFCFFILLSPTLFWSGPKVAGFFMVRKVDSPFASCLVFGDSEMTTCVAFGSRLPLSLMKVGIKWVLSGLG